MVGTKAFSQATGGNSPKVARAESNFWSFEGTPGGWSWNYNPFPGQVPVGGGWGNQQPVTGGWWNFQTLPGGWNWNFNPAPGQVPVGGWQQPGSTLPGGGWWNFQTTPGGWNWNFNPVPGQVPVGGFRPFAAAA